MKIVFVSNFFNHHQKPLCDAMIRHGVDFSFIAYTAMPEERIKMGYPAYDEPYVISHTKENHDAVVNLILEADVAIFGLIPEFVFDKRVQMKKLTFRFSERLYKKGRYRAWLPTKYVRLAKKYHCRSTGNHLYLLTASAYAAKDYGLLGFPKDHAFKWGYFPRVCHKSWEELTAVKTEVPTIVWVGRLIALKKPEMAVRAAAYLKEKNCSFQLKLIGSGPMEDVLREEIKSKNLDTCVQLVGVLPAEQVREEMEKATVALATSDTREGWGAVVNEEMSSGCAVLASREMGSVRYLIDDGRNGLIYSCRDSRALCEKLYRLVSNPEKCRALGYEAYQTINSLWNADVAAERFLKQADYILAHKTTSFEKEGPMSQGAYL